MGIESAEYLPLVSETCAQQDGIGRGRRRNISRLLPSREKLLVLVILLQAVALVGSVFVNTGNGAENVCQCPHREPLLYCEYLILSSQGVLMNPA